ncbi:MAG: bifunctional aldolase/short-chain dehydrogenase [Deltaproteobacteria bacterium]|nr:bifunctional aldolase/short-chain dehydrogenase [Deltaproteobacteria bacterium]MBK8720248.1 bifunctional aldolase/short-chain dehydrogenase [Deltaproteobacteria bacterium]MBP7287616.1 bifunctional aldolase/short-chain dehydrogenase [Nannocystaceae bacterium]
MHSSWSDADAQAMIDRFGGAPLSNDDVALRVYTSRLIGREPALVLHGGGNTSVKTTLVDDTGTAVRVLCVKGSGWDLGDIEPAGLPAVRLETLAALRRLPTLSDEDMVNAARTRLLDASAPNPSVETLLHAFLPYAFIDHSHADAILAWVDQADAPARCREVFGDALVMVPYVMPGFALAKLAAEIAERHPHVHGLLLQQHGLFTWGDTARESYERHIDAVDRAERAIAASPVPTPVATARADRDWTALAPVLRGRLGAGDRRYVLTLRSTPAVRRFVDDPALARRASRGPATPDHVLRTKPLPLVLELGDDPARHADETDSAVAGFRDRYRAYFERQCAAKGVQRRALDPDPRIVLIPGVGLVGVGADAKAAAIAADVYEHTIDVIEAADRVGEFHALPEGDLFDMEYWSLEQAKLTVGASSGRAPLRGRVVIVTGAAMGIGAAVARRMAAAGAQLWLVDRDAEALARTAAACKAPFAVLDVTDRDAVHRSVAAAVATFGGVDGLVSNAGTAPQAPIDACPPELLQGSLAVNLLAHQWFAEAVTRALKAQGRGGFLLFNASKSAFNPGPGFGPYAIAKAALVALMKQYAVEGGAHGIRANAVNADRVRTHLLDPEALAERARARGLEPEAYWRANLLGAEVGVDDVADAMLALALAERTTGTVLPVDGGNIAAAPR